MEACSEGLAHWLLFRDVKGNEGRTMLWSGTRPGDTMADLIFCLAYLRLQMTLEERLTRREIVNVTASARKGIFGGQHEEDCTLLFNPTFMDDLAVLVGTRQNRCWPNFRVHSRP